MHYATSCLPEIFDVLLQDLSCRTRSKWIFCTVIKTYSVQPMPSLFEQHCRNNIQVCKRYGLQIILITILHTILITTIILREFMWFIWGNADWATNRQTKPTHLGCQVLQQAATIHIHHGIHYYYSAQKLIFILPSHDFHKGWKAESTKALQ